MAKIISFLLLTSIFPLVAFANGGDGGLVVALMAFVLFSILVVIYFVYQIFTYKNNNSKQSIFKNIFDIIIICFFILLPLLINYVVPIFAEFNITSLINIILVSAIVFPVFIYLASPAQMRIQNTKITFDIIIICFFTLLSLTIGHLVVYRDLLHLNDFVNIVSVITVALPVIVFIASSNQNRIKNTVLVSTFILMATIAYPALGLTGFFPY